MDVAYAAHTESGTFMLDERGVCRWAVTETDQRIVGAQFVATLDLSSEQGLAALPKVGAPMLFAAVDASGHITLLRTGPLLRWEDKRSAGPASSARALPLVRPPSRPSSLPPPPARMRSDVAPKALPSVRNNFAPPPAPPKKGLHQLSTARVPMFRLGR